MTDHPITRIREAIGYDAYRPEHARPIRWLIVALVVCVVVALIAQEIMAFNGEWP